MASISANGAKGHHKFTLEVTQSATNIANNTSTLSFNFKLSPIETSWNWEQWNQSIAYTITINGTSYTGYIPDYDGYSVVTLKSGTQSVTHNNDGTKSIAYSFSVTDSAGQYYTSGNASASGTFTLSTIPRSSTISAVSGTTIGGTMTVTISRAVSTFTHQLWYKVGNSAWYDLGKDIGTSKSFTIDIATASQFPNATTGNLQLCLRTFNGSTVIGSDYYKDVTVSVPSYTPTISNISLTGNNLLSGEYVQGKSTVTAEITATTLYGASIQSYSATVDGKTYSGNKFTSSVLSNGSKSVSVTVTDTRGKTATLSSSTFTVRDYTNPVITEFTLARQSTETTVIATVKGSVSSVNSKNAKTIQVTLNGVTQTISSSSYTINGTTTFTNVPTDSTLTSVAKISDSYTQATREYVLPTVAVTMDFYKDGKGIAMGKVAETSGLLDVAWEIKTSKPEKTLNNLSFRGNNLISTNANDTIQNWSNQGNLATTFYTDSATGITKPSTWGFLLNVTTGPGTTEAHQLWFEQSNGNLLHRGGNSSGFGTWKTVIDSSNFASNFNTNFSSSFSSSLNATIKDYVVETGTSGIWTYRKWNSGIAECWGVYSMGSACDKAWGSLYYSNSITPRINYPFTFTSRPQENVFLRINKYSAWLYADSDGSNAMNTTTQTARYGFLRPTTMGQAEATYEFYVIGKWK